MFSFWWLCQRRVQFGSWIGDPNKDRWALLRWSSSTWTSLHTLKYVNWVLKICIWYSSLDLDMTVFILCNGGAYFMQKQLTKLSSLRSKTLVHSHYFTPFDVTNVTFTHCPGLNMFRHIRLQLKHFSFKGRNQWSRAFVCGGAAIQGAPSRTLRCYFNAIVWNKPAFFPAGQTEDSPHNSHPIPGRPPEVALVWDLFEVPPAERTSLKKHCWTPPSRPAGSGARGRCVLKSTTQNQGSLCAWELFLNVFLKLTFGRSTLQLHIQDSDPSESDCRTYFLPFFCFSSPFEWLALATSEHLSVSDLFHSLKCQPCYANN